MNENGKVLVVDNVIPPLQRTPAGASSLILICSLSVGAERTKNEFAAIFAEAGFEADPGVRQPSAR